MTKPKGTKSEERRKELARQFKGWSGLDIPVTRKDIHDMRESIRDYKGTLVTLTPKLINTVCAMIEGGIPEKLVFETLGIANATVKRWLEQAEFGEPYRSFSSRLLQARARDWVELMQDPEVRKAASIAKAKKYVGSDEAPTAVQVNVGSHAGADVDAISEELLRRATLDVRGKE